MTPEGWECEPDQRHADILIQAMNLSGAKGVKAPGEDEKNWEMSENDQAVDPKEETPFRALVARANFFGLGPQGPAVRDEGGVQRHGGADEWTCEEIEEAHPILHWGAEGGDGIQVPGRCEGDGGVVRQ